LILYKFDNHIITHYEVHHDNKVLHVNGYIDKFMSISSLYYKVMADPKDVSFIKIDNNRRQQTGKVKLLEFEHIEDLIDLIPEEFI